MRLPHRNIILAASPGALAFALYWRTMARHGDMGNGLMLTVAADELGVPSRTGHPLYVLAAHAFLRWLPVGEPILRTTIFSAVSAALAVAVVGIAAYRLTKRWWAGAFAGALFGVSDALWSHAVVAEVCALHALLSACTLSGVLGWIQTGSRRSLYVATLCFGLSIANAPIALTWAPMMLAALMVGRPKRAAASANAGSRGAALIAVGLLPLLLYLLVPVFAARDPLINFAAAGPSWLDRPVVTWHTRWRAAVDYFGIPEEHVREGYLLLQYGLAVIWLAPVGLWRLARRRREVLAVTVLAYLGPVACAIGTGAGNAGPLYIASHMVVALWLAVGARAVVFAASRLLRRALRERAGRKRLRALLILGMLGLPAFVMAGNYRAIARSGSQPMTALGRAMLDRTDRNAVIIVSGTDWAYPAFYVQRLERRRPDVVLLLDAYFRWPNLRLIERERRRGLVIRAPGCRHKGKDLRSAEHAWCCMHQLIWDNHSRRKVYVAGPLAGLIMRNDPIRDRLPPCRRLAPGLPMIEFEFPGGGASPPAIPEPPAMRLAMPSEPAAHHHEHHHEDAH
ncbi:MAG: DUF2723 domain-containing protein [Chthonomonadales bacterium]|nr:DUF2723 domain-containing protein [Chthonomonadales bacterium]